MYVKAGEIQKAVDTCVYLNHVRTSTCVHACVCIFVSACVCMHSCMSACSLFLHLYHICICVLNHLPVLLQWDLALKVAEQHQVPDIDKLLSTYVVSLLQKKKVFAAIMLYMKAKQHLEAAKLIFKVK